MDNLKIFEDFISEAFITEHFRDRFKLRCLDVNFEGSLYHHLTEGDIVFVREKILSDLQQWYTDLEEYSMKWNSYEEDKCYVFRFGDIIIRKNNKYYYPQLRVPDGKSAQGYEIGSNFVAVAWAHRMATVLLIRRKCKYNAGKQPCLEPMDMEQLHDIVRTNRNLMQNRNSNFTIEMAPEKDLGDARKWDYPKFRIIDIPSEHEVKLAAFNQQYSGDITIKRIESKSPIIYERNGEYKEKYINQYKNLDTKENFNLEFFLSASPGGATATKQILKRNDKMVVRIPKKGRDRTRDEFAEEMGYTHYLTSVERYSPVNGSTIIGDLYCKILRPIKIGPDGRIEEIKDEEDDNVFNMSMEENKNTKINTAGSISEKKITKSSMKHVQVYEAYSDSQEIKLTSRQGRDIIFSIKGGRIESIQNDAGIRFPYSVGQNYNMNMKTWACNNGFKWNGEDPCPEEKVFGIRKKDIPQGHELRMMFPHKFRN